MNKLTQNDMEYLIDQVKLGNLTPDQANVEKVRMSRFLIVSKLTADVRRSLNTAVKSGHLCHKKKDGRKPEVYYHPSFEHLANEARSRAERETLEALARVIARP